MVCQGQKCRSLHKPVLHHRWFSGTCHRAIRVTSPPRGISAGSLSWSRLFPERRTECSLYRIHLSGAEPRYVHAPPGACGLHFGRGAGVAILTTECADSKAALLAALVWKRLLIGPGQRPTLSHRSLIKRRGRGVTRCTLPAIGYSGNGPVMPPASRSHRAAQPPAQRSRTR